MAVTLIGYSAIATVMGTKNLSCPPVHHPLGSSASWSRRWRPLASRTRACSPGTAELPGCWRESWGWAHPGETVTR